mmetsp:Transcript_12703/g.37296  ORF Transcript_12703/g.37296 Transcript_12703/m.37296 type:complete len:245 (-) Transcript_12703:171-905(-)
MSAVNPAALEFRHSYIDPSRSHHSSLTPVQKQNAYTDLLKHEQMERPIPKVAVPRPPPSKVFQHERSLPTNVPDHPTAIQVNGLRQTATPLPHWAGYVAGVNKFKPGVLEGNWEADRLLDDYEPGGSILPSGHALNWETTTQLAAKAVKPYTTTKKPSQAAENMYETTQMAAAKDVTDPKPKRDIFDRPGFNLEEYRRDWTIGNEVTLARFSSTETRDQFKPYPHAAHTTGYPKNRAGHAGLWH